MPFTISIERSADPVRYRVSGIATLQNYCDLIDEAARDTLAHGDRRAMVDLLGVAGRLLFTDQFFIGDLVARKLNHIERLAALVPDDPDSYTSPKVATRQGVSLQGFRDNEEALAWLRESLQS